MARAEPEHAGAPRDGLAGGARRTPARTERRTRARTRLALCGGEGGDDFARFAHAQGERRVGVIAHKKEWRSEWRAPDPECDAHLAVRCQPAHVTAEGALFFVFDPPPPAPTIALSNKDVADARRVAQAAACGTSPGSLDDAPSFACVQADGRGVVVRATEQGSRVVRNAVRSLAAPSALAMARKRLDRVCRDVLAHASADPPPGGDAHASAPLERARACELGGSRGTDTCDPRASTPGSAPPSAHGDGDVAVCEAREAPPSPSRRLAEGSRPFELRAPQPSSQPAPADGESGGYSSAGGGDGDDSGEGSAGSDGGTRVRATGSVSAREGSAPCAPLGPSAAGAAASPVRSGAAVSPVRVGAAASPVRVGAAASPVRVGAAASPVRSGAAVSPVRVGAAVSPVRVGDTLALWLDGDADGDADVDRGGMWCSATVLAPHGSEDGLFHIAYDDGTTGELHSGDVLCARAAYRAWGARELVRRLTELADEVAAHWGDERLDLSAWTGEVLDARAAPQFIRLLLALEAAILDAHKAPAKLDIVAWRAAVESCRTLAQLDARLAELDAGLRWPCGDEKALKATCTVCRCERAGVRARAARAYLCAALTRARAAHRPTRAVAATTAPSCSCAIRTGATCRSTPSASTRRSTLSRVAGGSAHAAWRSVPSARTACRARGTTSTTRPVRRGHCAAAGTRDGWREAKKEKGTTHA